MHNVNVQYVQSCIVLYHPVWFYWSCEVMYGLIQTCVVLHVVGMVLQFIE